MSVWRVTERVTYLVDALTGTEALEICSDTEHYLREDAVLSRSTNWDWEEETVANYQSPIWLTDLEAETVLGILAELLEGREDDPILGPVLEQLYRQVGEEPSE